MVAGGRVTTANDSAAEWTATSRADDHSGRGKETMNQASKGLSMIPDPSALEHAGV